MTPSSSNAQPTSIADVVAGWAQAIDTIRSERGSAAVAIAGPSGVGKSYMSCLVGRELRRSLRIAVARLSLDSFLKRELRGEKIYRMSSTSPLTPEHYEFERLRRAVLSLVRGGTVTIDEHDHERGWLTGAPIIGRVVLVDGLFLWPPSAPITLGRVWDLRMYLDAPEPAVERWRRERDAGRRTARESAEEWHRVSETWRNYVAPAASGADSWVSYQDAARRYLLRR